MRTTRRALGDTASADKTAEAQRMPDFGSALHRTLIESRQRYKDLAEAVSDFCWETDADGIVTFVSPKGALGWAAHDIAGRPIGACFGTATGEGMPEVFRARTPLTDDDVWLRRADGTSECLSVTAAPLVDENGIWRGCRGLARIVTGERQRQRDAAQHQLGAQLAAHLANTIQSEVDPVRGLLTALSAVGLALSATGGVLLRIAGDGAFGETGQWGIAAAATAKAGAIAQLAARSEVALTAGGCHLLGITTAFRGERNGAALLWRETERGAFGEEDRTLLGQAAGPLGSVIARLASHESALLLARIDPLTGVLNSRTFLEEAQRRLDRMKRPDDHACVIFADLDNFKLVNDSQGHGVGDTALIEVCRLLQDSARSDDLVARLGGDEFAIWLDGVGADIGVRRAEEIIEKSAALRHFSGDPARPFGLSLGIAVYDTLRPETVKALIKRADGAMYEAKRHRKGGNFAVAEPTRGVR